MTPDDFTALESDLRASANDAPQATIELSPTPPLDLPDRAAAAGLLDVAYATYDSPAGRLLLAATPRGLVRLAYVDAAGEEDAVLEQLAARVSPRVLASPRSLDEPRRELDQYFSGARRDFELALDWQLTRGFGRRVLEATARIPFGSVSTYKTVAAQAGSPRGSRAAGNALGANPIPIIVPCHRVLHTTGGLGGYTGGLHRKRLLLGLERGQLAM
ncbi:MAG TPA: methylated-DNA--[protein]-cysteine S-methyltransferase [Solirubrobacteraceae bacterium]|nr:methylated-DNA--[protein]-cysteine S-methyltransferase [Solirubrobacteraceae bacterium]